MTREEKAQFCIDNPYKSPAFQFYPDNWWGSRHVTMMTIEQRGIHASLIFTAWLEPCCGIPETEICLSARIPDDKKPIALQVLSWCWFLYKGFWFCERLLNERIKQVELSKERYIAGCKGGRPLKSKINRKKPIDNHLITKSKPNHNQTEEEEEEEKEDIIITSFNLENKDRKEDAGNEESDKEKPEAIIYRTYPRKAGHKKALESINIALKKISSKDLLEKVRIYAESVKTKEQKFIPMPATWFNQERWNDPIEKSPEQLREDQTMRELEELRAHKGERR